MSLETRAEPYVLGPGEAREEIDAVVAELRWLVRGEESGGGFNLVEYLAPERFAGPGLHVHRDEDEALFVVEGTLTVRQGEEEANLGPGGFAWQPRGVPHGFANRPTSRPDSSTSSPRLTWRRCSGRSPPTSGRLLRTSIRPRWSSSTSVTGWRWWAPRSGRSESCRPAGLSTTTRVEGQRGGFCSRWFACPQDSRGRDSWPLSKIRSSASNCSRMVFPTSRLAIGVRSRKIPLKAMSEV